MQCVTVFIVWTLSSIIIQSVVLRDFPSVWVWSDLLFYLVIILGLRFGLMAGVVVAALIGYVADSMSVAPHGTALISYVVVLLFIRKVKANIYIERRVALFFWIVVFSMVKQAVQVAYLAVSAGGMGSDTFVVWRLVMQAIWDAVLGVLIVPLIEKALFTNWAMVFRRKGLKD